MSDWEIKINKTAKKYLDKMEPRKKENLLQQIRELKNWVENKEQSLLDIKALKGQWQGKFRLRGGGIRTIFEIITLEKQIKILYIGPRGDIY
ncbi:MAG: type II toxin-antitoxin system RelE/ParE family toxin [bacterium]|nr:type II toxin-antitoxin system RelE/ParE family toxin [bacterium]